MLAPDIAARVTKKQAQNTGSGTFRLFEVGDSVWAKSYRQCQNWGKGFVIRKQGGVDYEVLVDSQVWQRHANQLKERFKTTMEPASPIQCLENPPLELPPDNQMPASEVVADPSVQSSPTTAPAPISVPPLPDPANEVQPPPQQPRRNLPRSCQPPDRLDL